MAVFKINRGLEKNLPTALTDGYAYFCTDNQNFYIDFIDGSGVITRKKLGVEYAEKLRYLDGGSYVEIDPTKIATTDGNNLFTGRNQFKSDAGIVIIDADSGKSVRITPPLLNGAHATQILSTDEDNAVLPIIFGGSKLKEIDDPADDTDAANKKYVDSTINGLRAYMGEIPESAASGTIISYIKEEVDNLHISDYANIIENITVASKPLPIIKKSINIPLATAEQAGVVQGSTTENKISVGADGTMEINNLTVDKLVQPDSCQIVLNGGNSTN